MAVSSWKMCSRCCTFMLQKKNGNFMKHVSAAFCANSNSNNSEVESVRVDMSKRDPAPFFFHPEVQALLKKLTGFDLKKIFRTEPRRKFETPRYEFMTEEQLKKSIEDATERGRQRLQMPPVLKCREEINEVLSYDPELKGYDDAKFIFVDISLRVPDRKRYIVCRDSDGTLRKASWEERDKMTKIFFPRPKQKIGIPKMFLDDNLTVVLDEGKHEFVLDRACWQFEPDDPGFIKVCHQTYDHIDKHRSYDTLLSTRHYGPLVFYLAFYKSIDNLLLHLIQNDRLNEGADVVRLYCAVNADSKTSRAIADHRDMTLLKVYTELDSHKRHSLELALQTYEELQRQQQRYMEEVKEAHGQR